MAGFSWNLQKPGNSSDCGRAPSRGNSGAIPRSSPCMNSTPLYSSRARLMDDGSSLRNSSSAQVSMTSPWASWKKRCSKGAISFERGPASPSAGPYSPSESKLTVVV